MDRIQFNPKLGGGGVSKIRSCENACFYRYLQCFQGVGGSGRGVCPYIYIYIHTCVYICVVCSVSRIVACGSFSSLPTPQGLIPRAGRPREGESCTGNAKT